MAHPTTYKQLKDKLNIDETYTHSLRNEPKNYDRVKDNVPNIEGLNFNADLLYMPKTKNKELYLLVITDLASKAFDIEPLKKKDSKSVLEAFNNILKRNNVDITKKHTISIRTDSGKEFMGEFHNFVKNNLNILHSISSTNRHRQNANIENLNRLLGRLFNGFMNSMEKKTANRFNDWSDVIKVVRTDLNRIRKQPTQTHKEVITEALNKTYDDLFKGKGNYPSVFDVAIKNPKFKVNDLVYHKLDYPENALGNKQDTATFREGDYRWSQIAKPISKVLLYNHNYRYLLDKNKNVSYAENELKKSSEEKQRYIIDYIDGKKIKNRKVYYIIKWKGQRKKTEEPKTELMKDIPIMIKEYEEDMRNGVPNRRKK